MSINRRCNRNLSVRYGTSRTCFSALRVTTAMVALYYLHSGRVQQNHSIHAGTDTGLAEYTLVFIKKSHLSDWISTHCIYRANVNTGRSFTRPTDIGQVNSKIIIADNLYPSKAWLESTLIFGTACKFTNSTACTFCKVNDQM